MTDETSRKVAAAVVEEVIVLVSLQTVQAKLKIRSDMKRFYRLLILSNYILRFASFSFFVCVVMDT